MIDLSERPMYPEIGNCDLFSDARRETCYERGKISYFRSKLTVRDIRVSLPSPYGKTQGHALYNRPLDAHARRRKAGEKTWNLPGGEQNIYILFSEISGLFHRRKCCRALFVLNFEIAPANTGNNRSRDFIMLSSWEVPSLFSCFSSTSMRI